MKGFPIIADLGDKRITYLGEKRIINFGNKASTDFGDLSDKKITDFDDKGITDLDDKGITKFSDKKILESGVKRISNVSVSMGNVCIFNQNNNVNKVSSSPHTLEELLSGIANPEDISADNVTLVIDSNPWARRFKEYLIKRNLEDDLNILKFLVMVQAIRTKRINKKNPKELHNFKSKKVLAICETFFSEESDNQLPLSNQVLWMQLFAMTNSLKAGLAVSDEALDDVIAARKDPAVWDEGLEPIFMKFVLQTPGPTLACLLSIL